jgi:hypothetical protein
MTWLFRWFTGRRSETIVTFPDGMTGLAVTEITPELRYATELGVEITSVTEVTGEIRSVSEE